MWFSHGSFPSAQPYFDSSYSCRGNTSNATPREMAVFAMLLRPDGRHRPGASTLLLAVVPIVSVLSSPELE